MTPLKKYITLVYAKDSDLIKIEDLTERKKIAAEQCDIDVPQNTKETSKLIIEFLRSQNHYKFTLLMAKEELLTDSLEIMLEPLKQDPDDDKRLKNIKLKGDVNDLCGKLEGEIDALRRIIFTEEFSEDSKKVISIEERLKKQTDR